MNNTSVSVIEAFGLNKFAVETQSKSKANMADTRKECIDLLKSQSVEDSKAEGLTWERCNAVINSFGGAITPSKGLYVAYFGDDLGKECWEEVEARWRLLQGTALLYVEELNDRSIGAVARAALNKERRKLLFAQMRSLLRFHGIDLGRDLTPRDLIAIGEAAIKYAYTFDDDTAEVRPVGVTVFIKVVLWGLAARNTDSHRRAIDKICSLAFKAASKIRGKRDTINWNEGDCPLALKK